MFEPPEVNYSYIPYEAFEKYKQKKIKFTIELLQKEDFTITNFTDNNVFRACFVNKNLQTFQNVLINKGNDKGERIISNTRRYELTEEQWEQIKGLISLEHTGKKVNHVKIINLC